MTPLPVVSGREVIAALGRMGYAEARRKGSHVRLRHPDAAAHPPLTVPDHREIKPGLLRALIRDAGLTVDEFVSLLA